MLSSIRRTAVKPNKSAAIDPPQRSGHEQANHPPADAWTRGCQMGIFGHGRAWRAAIAVLGLASLAPTTDAATLLSPGTATMLRASVEPFGLSSTVLTYGGLHDKWLGVARQLDDEQVQLALCDGDRGRCVSPAALRLLAIVDNARARAGRARLGEINRAINLAIRPMSDLAQYGQIDV